jgi:hypothetical protein
MPKTYIKKKAGPSLGYRTPDNFRSRKFGAKKNIQSQKSVSGYRTQHKG